MAVSFIAIQTTSILAKEAQIIYEPSVFNGTGNEVRRNLVLKVEQSVRDELLKLEEGLATSGMQHCSVVKPETIRVKLDMNAVRLFDADHKSMPAPGRWTHSNVEVRLEVRGTWKTATNCGLAFCCTDVRFCSDEQAPHSGRLEGHDPDDPDSKADRSGEPSR